MKHKFQNPTIKQIVRHLIEMDRTEFQTVEEFMGDALCPENYERFVDLAFRKSVLSGAPVHAGPKFREDILDDVACKGWRCEA